MFINDEYIGDDEFDNLMHASQQSLREDINEHIKKNKDNAIKEVGDNVLMWDTSRLTDVETDEVNVDELDHRLMCMFPSIVIETNCKYDSTIVIGENKYTKTLDLIVWNKIVNKKFRTSSSFVKLL